MFEQYVYICFLKKGGEEGGEGAGRGEGEGGGGEGDGGAYGYTPPVMHGLSRQLLSRVLVPLWQGQRTPLKLATEPLPHT